MVRREVVSEGKVIYWIDGRLPPKTTLISRTSIRKMVRRGIDRDTVIRNPLYQRSYRCRLDRYDNLIQLLDLFMSSTTWSPEEALDFRAYLLDPFTEAATRPSLAHELAEAKMYHKNRKNFRVLLLFSNIDYATKVEEGVEQLVCTIPFTVSPAESFEDYDSFQDRLNNFLLEATELVNEPSALQDHLCKAGFRIERSIYRNLKNTFY